jgi:hypothetical protein
MYRIAKGQRLRKANRKKKRRKLEEDMRGSKRGRCGVGNECGGVWLKKTRTKTEKQV